MQRRKKSRLGRTRASTQTTAGIRTKKGSPRRQDGVPDYIPGGGKKRKKNKGENPAQGKGAFHQQRSRAGAGKRMGRSSRRHAERKARKGGKG